MSGEAMMTGTLIWQIFCLLVIGGIAFLAIRLLIIKNFPSKSKATSSSFRQDIFPVVITWRATHSAFKAEVPDLAG